MCVVVCLSLVTTANTTASDHYYSIVHCFMCVMFIHSSYLFILEYPYSLLLVLRLVRRPMCVVERKTRNVVDAVDFATLVVRRFHRDCGRNAQ